MSLQAVGVWATVAQTVVLIFTLGVVWKYTSETQKLRKLSEEQIKSLQRQEDVSRQHTAIAQKQAATADKQADISLEQVNISKRQSELFVQQMDNAIRPFVMLDAKTNDTYCVKNWGVGPALNVRVDDVLFYTKSAPDEPDWTFTLHFPIPVPLLGPGEERLIEFQSLAGGHPIPEKFMLHPKRNRPLKAVLHYANMEGKQYTSHQTYGHNSLRLSGVQDVVNNGVDSDGANGTTEA